MNEQIRLLLVEAREQTREGKWHAPTAVWAEKFAELIVRECVSQLNIPDVPGTISAGLNLGKIAIKQHFGVEE
jgi:hypothetical protein